MTPVTGWEEVQVHLRTLDEVLDEYAISRVDLLKLDVEGFEAEVLAGSGRALAEGRIGAVLCEFNDYWLRANNTTPENLWKTLTAHGFRAESHPVFAPGGIVNAFFVKDD